MPLVLVISADTARAREMAASFPRGEFATRLATDAGCLEADPLEEAPDLVVVDAVGLSGGEARRAVEGCGEGRFPSLVVLPEEAVAHYGPEGGADDFLVAPFRGAELVARGRQLLHRLKGGKSPDTLRVGDLVIDQGRYEVAVAGRRVVLTFKEYELLRLLASSPGRVFSREELLSRVWGYNYFGGTRTVDVHVRRLRSKVEDAHHTFVETVWNVGYRLRSSQAPA